MCTILFVFVCAQPRDAWEWPGDDVGCIKRKIIDCWKALGHLVISWAHVVLASQYRKPIEFIAMAECMLCCGTSRFFSCCLEWIRVYPVAFEALCAICCTVGI